MFKTKKEMTKKELKEYNNSKRGSWGEVNPCSKVIPDKKKEANKRFCRRNGDHE